MKIVCDNCATKYSIADEKVRGKVFKIRCKKCSYIIVVRGGDGAAAAAPHSDAGADAGFPGDDAAARPSSAGVGTGEAVWHLVVDREQVGPLTREEVRAKFGAGEIDVETYAWREGFGDWLRLGSIDDFRDLAGGAAPAAEPTTKRTDSADLFANAAAGDEPAAGEGGNLFGGSNAPSAPTGETPMPAAGGFPSGAGAGLFSAPQPMAAAAPARQRAATAPGYAAPAGGGGGEALAAAPADAKSKMTGQRNENSVLFSLNNLQALASGGGGSASGGAAAPKASSSSSSSPGEGQRPGFASSQNEGSGLIDIRAMAASTLSAPSSSAGRGSDDGPSFASAPMFSPMAAPILMPAPASGPPKWLWPVLGVALAAVVGIVVLGVVMLTRKPDLPVVAAVPPQPLPAALPIAAPVAPPPTTPVVAPAAPTAPAAVPTADEGDKKHHGGKGKHDKKDNPAATPGSAAPAPAAPAATPKKPGGKRDELDNLLNNAAPDRPAPKRSAPAEAPAAAGKERLEKGDIVAGMSKVKGRVAGCYDQFKVPGLANVSVTISPSGRVSSANVSGSFSGTPTGECVEKAVKSASFPAAKEGQTITYPFMLR